MSTKKALVIGASRTLGAAVVRELSDHGWEVTGTVRGDRRTELHDLADEPGRTIHIESVDITDDAQIDRLREQFSPAELDLIFINAGITDPDVPVGEVSADVFSTVMVTNALAPLHAIERLADRVSDTGTIGVMSSRQGSIGMNTRGGHEVYRASKSALNQLMRSYATRAPSGVTLLLMHPGWVQTELGGEGATLTVAQSAHGVVGVMLAHARDGGLQFLDYQGNPVAW
ncbi:3-oxoacyl-ACP reductase [Branchiibius sp. NY16-3462-2]|nr:3-oxoacyl-ACP reductase [Branchiibius sp. NY16-3462-2]